MDLSAIIAQLIGGAVGGSAGGKIIKDSDLGNIGNLITGAVGGSIIGRIVNALITGAGVLRAEWTSAPSPASSSAAVSPVRWSRSSSACSRTSLSHLVPSRSGR